MRSTSRSCCTVGLIISSSTTFAVGHRSQLDLPKAKHTSNIYDGDGWSAGCLFIRGGSSSIDAGQCDHEGRPRVAEESTRMKHKLPPRNSTSTHSDQDVFRVSNAHRKAHKNLRKRKNWLKERGYWKALEPKRYLDALSVWTNYTTNKAREQFYDKIELVTDALITCEQDAALAKDFDMDENLVGSKDMVITQQSDLSLPGRKIFVVTTASLPWFTGTAVNPLLRAAYLCRRTNEISKSESLEFDKSQQLVTLVLPWLELEEDRLELYGHKYNFTNSMDQEEYIRKWLREEAAMPYEADRDTGLKIIWYPARYHRGQCSIFAMGDMISLIPDDDADVVILEEPEHLNWYRPPGEGWAKKFNFSTGIIHTNYVSYASSQYHGLWTAPALALMSSAMIRAYCHKVIKLSGVLQSFAPEKEVISNVHGVRSDFLVEGQRRAAALQNSTAAINNDSTQAYFIGKIIWAKGLDKLLELQDFYRKVTGEYLAIDIFGSGPDLKEIVKAYHGRRSVTAAGHRSPDTMSLKVDEVEDEVRSDDFEDDLADLMLDRKTRKALSKLSKTAKRQVEAIDFELPRSTHEFRKQPIPATFPGRVDHALVKEHKIFVNPSLTEVLCTTTAEALAMGKFVIIPLHPSNMWFRQFPNCLMYRTKWEFAASLKWALTHDPEPLSPELAHQFTWEAATDRFIKAAAITRREALEREASSKLDERIEWFHKQLGKSDALRKIIGGGPVSDQVKYAKAKQQSGGDESRVTRGSEDAILAGSGLADALSSTLASLLPPTFGDPKLD